jgi:hypothetical protein
VEFDASFSFRGTYFDERSATYRTFSETTSNTHNVTVEIDAHFNSKDDVSLDVHNVHANLDELELELDTRPVTRVRLSR